MNKKIILALFCYLALQTLAAQNITEEVYNSYEKYKENALEERRIKHYMLQPLISRIAENKKFTVNKVGESIEGRDLKLISIGSVGPIYSFGLKCTVMSLLPRKLYLIY